MISPLNRNFNIFKTYFTKLLWILFAFISELGRTYSVKPLSFSASLQKYQNIVRLTKVNLTASSSLRSTGAPNHTDCQSVVLHWMMDRSTNAIGACNNENWVGFILFRWAYLKKHLDHVVHSVLRLKSCKRNPGVFLLLRWLSCS